MAKSKPSSAPASVPEPDSSPGEARIQAASKYRCSIKDNAEAIIEASSPEAAQKIYLTACGITATENPVTVAALS
jgi:hypothetical protein